MIFADTSFIVAGIDRNDHHHRAAVRLLGTLDRDHPIVTTNQVRGETWTTIRRKLGHRNAVEFLDGLDRADRRFEICHVEPVLEEEALTWLRRHDEREYSFVDATSFAYMRRHGITEALAFDSDFTAAGFVELRP
ncbi:MAG: type II toxin-antitoxin system VapC family toxin [Solirubrobacterales bacterium]